MRAWIAVNARFAAPPEDWARLHLTFQRFGIDSTEQRDEPPTLIGYLPEPADPRGLVEALREAGAARVDVERVEEENWAEAWRAFFRPRRFGGRLLVCPSWCREEPRPGEALVVLDPGQAFGTGDHPTTALCLELLVAVDPAGRSVADVGCGSGILGIAAAELGARRVWGSDVDPLAVEIARANAKGNRVDAEFVVASGFGEERGPFDIVVSNILSEAIIDLAPEVGARLAPAGVWIASGIIAQNWPDVRRAIERAGFRVVRLEQEGEWITALSTLP